MKKNPPLSSELNEKLCILQNKIKNLKKVCIAYSGGVDSTLLLKVAYEVLEANVLAITAKGAMLPTSEFIDSQDIAKTIGVSPIVIDLDVFSLEGFVSNTKDRCYYCKKFIFKQIKKAALSHDFDVLLDGSNLDDMNDYRPGIRALGELGVYSPLKEAGLTKQDIRDISSAYNLPTATKPAMACLATRIPTNTPITPEALLTIESGEELLKSLGLSQYRLRLIGDTAKIECSTKDFEKVLTGRDTIINSLKKQGIHSITLDLEGYSCGKMNG